MEVYIPSFRYEESDLERGYTVGAGRGGTVPREPGLRLLSPEGSSGSRRPCAGLRGGVPSLPSLSLPPRAHWEGCAPARVSRKQEPPPWRGGGGGGRSGCPGLVPSPSLPSSRPLARSAGSRILGRGARHSPRRQPSGARDGLRSFLAQLLLCPDRSVFAGGLMLVSKLRRDSFRWKIR